MSEEQLTAFLTALKANTGLQEKLKGAVDFDAAMAIAKEAGFDVSKADWLLNGRANQTLELSGDELETVAAGAGAGERVVTLRGAATVSCWDNYPTSWCPGAMPGCDKEPDWTIWS
jgi:predicted ribosomally synthesized peptide with nif11-like leader